MTESNETPIGLIRPDTGRIFFQGTGAELLAAHDDYLKEFLFMTLPPW